jgi:septal ring factor EnvC (AmiA/AmiB activator)
MMTEGWADYGPPKDSRDERIATLEQSLASRDSELSAFKRQFESNEEQRLHLIEELSRLADQLAACQREREEMARNFLNESFLHAEQKRRAEADAGYAEVGRLVFRYVDRMFDPGLCDPLEKIVGEFEAAFNELTHPKAALHPGEAG